MPDQPTREEVARLIADDALIALRVQLCETVSRALQAGARYLHVPAAVSEDRNVKGLSMVADMCADLLSGTTLMFKAEHWYAGEALMRQIIECEYLLALFARAPKTASSWLDATEKELRNWWRPNAMREHLDGQFDDREYWDHCERGGHPVPSAAPFLSGALNNFDRRFCWIDFAVHARRIFIASVTCFTAFGLKQHLEETAYAQAYDVITKWSDRDPAPGLLAIVPRV